MDILNKEINLNQNFQLDQNFTVNQLNQNFTTNQLNQNFTTNQLDQNFTANNYLKQNSIDSELNQNSTTDNESNLNSNLINKLDQDSNLINKLDQDSNLINKLDQDSNIINKLDQDSNITNKLDQDSNMINKLDQEFSTTKISFDDSTETDENDDKPCPICDRFFVDGEFWIMCDVCKIWYHSECEKVIESEADEIEEYHCKSCSPHYGPSKHNIQNNHRYDRTINDSNHSLPTQIGTTKFIEELKQNRKFKKLEKVYKINGYQVTMDFLLENGFDRPILVENAEGLRMKIPKEFNLDVLLDRLGSNYTVDVINVYRQETDPMKLIQLVDALNNKDRDDKSKILNCISLELSSTELSDEIEPPHIVRHNLSWADNVYCDEDKPAVQKYLLLSMKDSYTDFHIDFSGTSVWYHIYRGSKIFYFIEPTETNIKAYEKWLVKENHSEIFFPDEIEDECYFYELKQGDTMLLPAGWIHGVYTPDDSIVFGGNFLNIFRADLQIKIFELEERQETAEKFKFPAFKFTHWVAVKFVYNFLKDLIRDNKLNKELCTSDPRCKQLYDSFRSYLNFTLKYVNEFNEATAKSYEKELLTKNSSKYNKSLDLMDKLLEKINPYGKNEDISEIKNTKINGALNNHEDLPQKSVKLKIEDKNCVYKRKQKEESFIDTEPKRRKNLIPLESKRSKTFSNKIILPIKKVPKPDSEQLNDLISITNNQNSPPPPILLLDIKKRKLDNAPLTNFKIPKKQKLIDSPKRDDQFNFTLSSNHSDKSNLIGEQQINSDDDWNDTLSENKSEPLIENKSERLIENKSERLIENKSDLITKLPDVEINKDEIQSTMNVKTTFENKSNINDDEDWDSPSMNTFVNDNQPKESDKSITNNGNCLPSIDKFEQPKEIKSNTFSTLNKPTTKSVYLPFDIRSTIKKDNGNPNKSSDDKMNKPTNDSSSKQFEKSFNNDQQLNGNKSRNGNCDYQQSSNNSHQNYSNNVNCNSYNNINKEDDHKSNYDSNYKDKQHYRNFSNGNNDHNCKQQNFKSNSINYNNGKQYYQNNNNSNGNYNNNNDDHKVKQHQQNYNNNPNRNHNGNQRNYNSNKNYNLNNNNHNPNNNNNSNSNNSNHNSNNNRNNYNSNNSNHNSNNNNSNNNRNNNYSSNNNNSNNNRNNNYNSNNNNHNSNNNNYNNNRNNNHNDNYNRNNYQNSSNRNSNYNYENKRNHNGDNQLNINHNSSISNNRNTNFNNDNRSPNNNQSNNNYMDSNKLNNNNESEFGSDW